jgi:transcriptional regulator with GAF, ATPase, and Fis domain
LTQLRREAADAAEKTAILAALKSLGSVRAAARHLGVHNSNLHRELRRLGLGGWKAKVSRG